MVVNHTKALVRILRHHRIFHHRQHRQHLLNRLEWLRQRNPLILWTRQLLNLHRTNRQAAQSQIEHLVELCGLGILCLLRCNQCRLQSRIGSWSFINVVELFVLQAFILKRLWLVSSCFVLWIVPCIALVDIKLLFRLCSSVYVVSSPLNDCVSYSHSVLRRGYHVNVIWHRPCL